MSDVAPVVEHFPIIHSLDVDLLQAGEHAFLFAVATDALGLWQQMPVRVFKGAKPGPKVMITAGVHGDEQNGIVTALKVAKALVGQSLAGCVTIVPTINLSGILHHSRDFHTVDPDVSSANLNRFFPGDKAGNEAARYLGNLWQYVLKPNAEIAIDLHTQTTGTSYPLYVFADYRIEQAMTLAKLMNPDVILNDPGESGVLESTWNQHGVPSITVEVGSGRYHDAEMVERAAEGVLNVLRYHKVLSGEVIENTSCLEGKQVISIRAKQGGFVEPKVSLLQKVEKGELLAIQYNSLGFDVASYYAPESGTVLSCNLEALRSPGSLIVRMIK
ncbi:succinylglutamate desuccinylase/aspartoacylase family protein [Vibrio coralliilyticus]|uniref:succinylglutamate desuccinylase/aspartoacylase family protein n=1 Tax=Vibrio coralliilyticus TaxID=190893 RepID=UPI00148D1763|nr:succinylglutamate desuccinylase/aspartoacylase family protein [Vibrio coralliilyticus]NOI27549.1 succinylglutamate desuccinylase/aspartoacylase family protein [Vibrio coralliilyticus]NOI47331.1 succinylglutamate desuccinylase/aspartoacylase family protein [Vibrio coralliilyticus]